MSFITSVIEPALETERWLSGVVDTDAGLEEVSEDELDALLGFDRR